MSVKSLAFSRNIYARLLLEEEE